ncbi:GNAT family N-acetyltransferase [Microlunatus sp. GCM10028923]|uniref:GNAT family N-acetyltransferase n=1 Tax=Microlunatus sp. GCM10028923 TaxID=3273400 RepID=UPI003606652A
MATRPPLKVTTKELSRRTFDDFSEFFHRVHGCACTLYFFGRHLTPLSGSAQERARLLGTAPDRAKGHFPHRDLMRQRELAAVKELVDQGKAHGMLAYANGEPVGWCNFGRADELPVVRDDSTPARLLARDPTSDWRITCLTTRMDHRRRGVATAALAAAVGAIKKRGGGWVEATPASFPHDDPMVRKLRRTFGWGSAEVINYLRDNWPSREIAGVGRVEACLTTSKTIGHSGIMSMYAKLGFEVAGLAGDGTPKDPRYPGHWLIMRRKV